MLLKRVVIDKFGNIDHLEQRFNDGLTVVRSIYSKDIMLAIAWALSYPAIDIGDFDKMIRKGTNIRLEVDDPNETEFLNCAMLSGQCRESQSCRILTSKNRESYAHKLRDYKYPDDYYKKGIFKNLTDNFGYTKVFRAYLYRFIKEHNESIAAGNPGLLIDGKGIFVLDNNEASALDLAHFQLDCYFTVNEFWSGASELHGPYLPQLPLLIEDADDMRISSSAAIKAKIKNVSWQVIIFKADNHKRGES